MINTKISNNGQITIPVEIQKKLGVKDGDDVYFRVENGTVTVENAFMAVLKTLQNGFAGEAERLGLKTDDDVVAMVKEVRREIYKNNARND
ncbi:MAG: AbrB/MazE/SpoVT family DNA-binding domain-containing protein [Deltaproteobacteria bacterium]|jgi:AbrB family looped-hinge helix DNA binding protein|nr:AbrB/MazE/SpoVT family DNA-binding domain-containing protein [Deltaproteobacteria bacterium]